MYGKGSSGGAGGKGGDNPSMNGGGGTGDDRKREFQRGLDTEETRRKRHNDRISLRKKQRQAHISKRRRELRVSGSHRGLSSGNMQSNPAQRSGSGPQLVEGFVTGLNRANGADAISEQQALASQVIPPWVTLKNLPRFVDQVKSDDLNQVYDGVQCIRQLLSVESKPPIQKVFDAKIVKKLLQIMHQKVAMRDFKHRSPVEDKQCKLQFEAAWAVTNIASGEREYTFQLCQAGAIEAFMALLKSTKDVETADQAIWGLGNIAGDGHDLRDLVLETGVLDYILENIFNFPTNMQRNAVWTVSNFCRGKPSPDWSKVSKILDPFTKILQQTKDYDIIVDILWAISFLSEDRVDDDSKSSKNGGAASSSSTASGGRVHNRGAMDDSDDEEEESYQVNAVLGTGVIKYVVQLVKHASKMGDEAWQFIERAQADARMRGETEEPSIPTQVETQLRTSDYLIAPCVRIMGNIVSGTDEQTDQVVSAGFFDVIEVCIQHRVKNIRKEACWALSNVVAGTQPQLDHFFQRKSLVSKVVKLALEGDINVRKEAGWCLSNAVCGATFEQVTTLVDCGFLEAMTEMLSLKSVEKVLFMAMEALDGCMQTYSKHFGLEFSARNEFAERVERLGGLDRLEEIQAYENISEKCQDMAGEIVGKYWPDFDDDELDDDEDDESGQDSGFGMMSGGGGGGSQMTHDGQGMPGGSGGGTAGPSRFGFGSSNGFGGSNMDSQMGTGGASQSGSGSPFQF